MRGIGRGLEPVPVMLGAIDAIHTNGLKVGALTNNWAPAGTEGDHSPHSLGELGTFDVVVESAVEGLRKPDPRIYLLACDRLGVTPHETVFLDDLGVNLKPARELGMTTIKVDDPVDALAELGQVLGFAVLQGA
jgi:epoxide hydrolase-like predicted phosphatase